MEVLEFFEPTSYLDIGANKGQNTENIRQLLPSLTHVEMIEATRSHETDLKEVSKKTGFPYRIEVLSDNIKNVNFYLDTKPNGPNSSYYPEMDNTFPTELRVTNTLDNLYPDQSFDLIKIDTQGSELDIIKGGLSLISKAKCLIIGEKVVPFNVGAPLSSDIKAFLEKNGFSFIRHLKWWGSYIKTSNGKDMWYEEVDSMYIRNDIIENLPKLPVSIGILSWQSDRSLRNSLESYKRNGLFKITDDITILFQEARDEDKELAKEYNVPYIALDNNVGIGKAFVMLSEQAIYENVLLLEEDWELTENYIVTRNAIKSSIKMLDNNTSVVRLRHRRNPGAPLFSQEYYQGRELDQYHEDIGLSSPLLFDCIHWVENPHIDFFGMISSENGFFTASSRWASWTNNPCLFKRQFYIDTVTPFMNKGLLLEPDILPWWARQKYKVAACEGLFTHNDIDKYN